jgi:peptidoglycan/xylan/chitin deacetylase (PgdA/CDA1 family)
MYQKYVGFAVIAVLGFAACHNVFNKDRSALADSVVIRKKNPSTSSDNSAGGVAAKPVTAPGSNEDSSLRYVYLTFDDGPDAGTLNCYDICKSKGVKATFFLVGEHANYPRGKVILDTMRKDMRHFLFANHSYTHAGHNHYDNFYKHSATALSDFLRTEDSMKFESPIVRFPGNPSWVMDKRFRTTALTRSLAKVMDSVGYNVMGWDVEWRFNKQTHPIQSAEEMASEIENAFNSKSSFVKNHVVLLTHDRMFKEANFKDSLAKMITILQSRKGYVFETADQYPILKKADKHLLAVRK